MNLFVHNTSRNLENKLFNKIFNLNTEYIARVNHVEPGMPAKKYFNALCDSFNADAKALLGEIETLAAK